MTPPAARRIARVRPLAPVQPSPAPDTNPDSDTARLPEQFFVANHATDFDSPAGRIWTVVASPFPGSRANANSNPRQGWEPGAEVAEESFTFLAPSVPANVLGMAHNTGQAGRDLPAQAFHKAATSVIGPGDAIELPAGIGLVEPEAELTVVVGRTAKNLTLDNARAAVLGYTIGNDVTARKRQKSDELWLSAKSQDTFTPAGPWIVTGLDHADLPVGVVHNGTELPAASTADLGWKVDEILVYLTSFLTLHPGDLVLTGFPAASAAIRPGDTVTCRVGGIGELSNPVTAAG
ncbi:fumarylacetoacetate hydrolase family protein [Arthrobacter globiformis]|uniref:fumarylacetoacetate hydrolase family protein n=1 Tax=Arthrobacter globiformis TaxID=1665 RepID=UPI00397BACCB